MRRGTTVYLYELAWILPSIAIPVGMLVALVVTRATSARSSGLALGGQLEPPPQRLTVGPFYTGPIR